METTRAAAAVVDLLNTRHFPFRPEQLGDLEIAGEVLRPFGQGAAPPSAQRLQQVRAIRDELVALAAGDAASGDEHWSKLTARMSESTFQYDFSGPREVRTRQVTGDPVVAGIAQAVAELVAGGLWTRIKLCAHDVCGSAFFDETRSRTQRWHSYDICGNRANVAAYRARAAGDGQE